MSQEEKIEFLEQVYRSEVKNMLQFTKIAMGNCSQAEDIVQTTFKIAMEKIDDFIYSPSPIGWLKTTLKNEIKNRRREQEKWQKLIIDFEVNNIAYHDEYFLETFSHSVDQEALELLNKIYIEGVPYLELANQMGISINALKMRVYRAKDKIKRQISSQ